MPRAGQIYGLGVEADVPIGAFAALPAPAAIQVRWRLAGGLPIRGAEGGPWRGYGLANGEPDEETMVRAFHAPALGLYRFEYQDGTVVVVDRQGENVWAAGPPGSTVEDTATYLLGPVMGFVLRLRGVPCLHASAIALGGRAVAFAGSAGSGKSTTAAAFARLGFAVVSDDVLAIDERGEGFFVRPAYPRVRLWPAAVRSLFGSADALPRITPTWEKRFLGLGPERCQASAAPLSAIYLLDEEGPSGGPGARLDPHAAMMALVAEAYSTRLLDKAMRAREFEVLARLVAKVPVMRLQLRGGIEGLPAMCQRLARDHAPL